MKMLRCLLPLLLALLFILPVLAEENDPADAFVRSAAETEITALQQAAAGWNAAVLADTRVESVTARANGSWDVTISYPDLSRATGKNELVGDDAKGYLERALTHYLAHDERREFVLNAKLSGEEGSYTIKWSANANPGKLLSTVKSSAKAAKESWGISKLNTAWTLYLCERCIDLPEHKPEAADMPTLLSLPAYGAEVADALGMSADEAAWRIAPVLLLSDVSRVDVSDGLENAVVTISYYRWTDCPEKGLTRAKELLQRHTGVPGFTRGQTAMVLTEGLSKSVVTARYRGKRSSVKIRVNLIEAVQNGRGTAKELMGFIRLWLNDTESAMTELIAYGAKLPFWQHIQVPDSGILRGQADGSGCAVTFDLGSDYDKNGYLRCYRDGVEIWSALVTGRMQLKITMQPGSYSFLYGRGSDWFGEDYLFTENGEYGSFDLTVPDTARLSVHLENSETGDVAHSALAWDDVRIPKAE